MPREVDDRRFLKWAALLVLLALIAFGVDRDARLRAQNASIAEGHKICPLIEALWPKQPLEVPTTAYGQRIIKAIEVSARTYRCDLPPLPVAH